MKAMKISSTKLQINHKLQYSMTKKFTSVVSHRFANQVLAGMIQLGMTLDGLFIWNFEFSSLRFV